MSGRSERGYSMILERGWKKIREWYSLASKKCRVAVNRAIANRDESSRYRKQSALDSTVLTRTVKGMAKEHEYKGKQDDLNGTYCMEWITHVRVLSSFAFIDIYLKLKIMQENFFFFVGFTFFSYSFSFIIYFVIIKKKISTNRKS